MLKIYNTLTRNKVIFTPIEEGKIRLYVCGMTVYDYCHIGHARVLVSFDVIVRFLRSQGWEVEYVRNITDVDDKIINRANESGEDSATLSQRFIDAMHEDEALLNIQSPNQEPRATDHMDNIIAMVTTLINKGYAYVADNNDVYYRVSRFEDYGQLSGKNTEELLSGARVDIRELKEDPRDFTLWKSCKEQEVSWQSPWGRGRPGWHIECSAMTKSCLGASFDIHGGGPDLPFPHHENEIAQSEAANGCKFVNYWMHAGAVRVDGEKMSKSLGNFFTIRDVFKKYHPEVIRYLIISSHYRSHINYSEDNLIEAKSGLERFYQTLKHYTDVEPCDISLMVGSTFYGKFVEAMNDDFNTRVALAVMYDMVKAINTAAKKDAEDARGLMGELKAMAGILGILQSDPILFLQGGDTNEEGLSSGRIEALIAERIQAKVDKHYARADEIREELYQKGVLLEDSHEGTSWRRK
ncbi:cysteine--tRNA ligase [Candidatus Endobugula sertula]|uniref:Cysteine--tRNA ligase n=1 Tax=Candidatus Endobugula sertula TaxID=62101 RepID=A0A1D2QT43_9GAMM|nr:cysteine--tRNA ligase [Candidatus Endobugula sertula]